MPGVGKSSVGVLLAKLLGLGYLDTDLTIQLREGASLQDILDRRGYRYLREVEESVLLEADLRQSVVSTGGSAVYSAAAMERLCEAGPIVYLRADLQTLEQRVLAAPPRGIASSPDQTFAQIYAERTLLYRQYAQHSVDTSAGSAQEVAVAVMEALLA